MIGSATASSSLYNSRAFCPLQARQTISFPSFRAITAALAFVATHACWAMPLRERSRAASAEAFGFRCGQCTCEVGKEGPGIPLVFLELGKGKLDLRTPATLSGVATRFRVFVPNGCTGSSKS